MISSTVVPILHTCKLYRIPDPFVGITEQNVPLLIKSVGNRPRRSYPICRSLLSWRWCMYRPLSLLLWLLWLLWLRASWLEQLLDKQTNKQTHKSEKQRKAQREREKEEEEEGIRFTPWCFPIQERTLSSSSPAIPWSSSSSTGSVLMSPFITYKHTHKHTRIHTHTPTHSFSSFTGCDGTSDATGCHRMPPTLQQSTSHTSYCHTRKVS